jgi:hypothetical protein
MKKKDFIRPETIEAIHALSAQDNAELRYNSLLKPGNAKTGKHGKYGAMRITKGLPIHDCPQRTEACSKVCYAIKFATWGSLKQGMAGHYSRLAHQDTEALYRLLRRDIQVTLVYEPDGFIIRIHEAGDFVSAEQVKFYQKLAEEFSSVLFYGYSRGWVDEEVGIALEAINQLPNVFIRESIDGSRPTGTGKAPLAYFGPKELEPKGAFKCPDSGSRLTSIA